MASSQLRVFSRAAPGSSPLTANTSSPLRPTATRSCSSSSNVTVTAATGASRPVPSRDASNDSARRFDSFASRSSMALRATSPGSGAVRRQVSVSSSVPAGSRANDQRSPPWSISTAEALNGRNANRSFRRYSSAPCSSSAASVPSTVNTIPRAAARA